MSKPSGSKGGKDTKKDSKRVSIGSTSGSVKSKPTKLTKPKTGSSGTVGVKRLSTSTPRRVVQKPKILHPLEQLFGQTLHRANGETASPKTLSRDDAVIGVYFSANWCPPCHTFMPLLLLLFEEMKKKDRIFDVVFISFDMHEQGFKEYFSKMPWWSVDFDDSDKREEISQKFSIMGIPMLLFLDAKTLDVISKNGREIVMSDPRGEFFPWKSMPKPATIAARYKEIKSLRDEIEKQDEKEAAEAEAARQKAEDAMQQADDQTAPSADENDEDLAGEASEGAAAECEGAEGGGEGAEPNPVDASEQEMTPDPGTEVSGPPPKGDKANTSQTRAPATNSKSGS